MLTPATRQVFFVPYILLEAPSNMVLHKCRPSFYLAGLVFGWGMINMSMGLVQNFASLVALRFLLGVFEAGLYPGIVYYTSMFYRRHEFQKRLASIFSASLIASAFSGVCIAATACAKRVALTTRCCSCWLTPLAT